MFLIFPRLAVFKNDYPVSAAIPRVKYARNRYIINGFMTWTVGRVGMDERPLLGP